MPFSGRGPGLAFQATTKAGTALGKQTSRRALVRIGLVDN